ncbi:Protein transport protein SBH1 [Nakaseomyces bracarensis]|uniref:Protein transport protein Sec61 subunit beta n=1 Tax=Nakaseomyces bracarensis TaxID=273131 RepID=A0ABR4NNF8_9SACH
MSTPPPPGGHRTLQKRRQAQAIKEKQQSQTPTSTRQAGFGGSSNTILKIFTDEADGLRVDPLVVLFLAVGFIFSVMSLHLIAKMTGYVF